MAILQTSAFFVNEKVGGRFQWSEIYFGTQFNRKPAFRDYVFTPKKSATCIVALFFRSRFCKTASRSLQSGLAYLSGTNITSQKFSISLASELWASEKLFCFQKNLYGTLCRSHIGNLFTSSHRFAYCKVRIRPIVVSARSAFFFFCYYT